MFSSNKKYKWLTFILKYSEDDYVKKQLYLEKIKVPVFVQKGSTT
jgi:hypothetical protein